MADEILDYARQIMRESAGAVEKQGEILGDSFRRAVDLIYNSERKVVVTGMGKSGHIGRKIAASLASTGTPAIFLHPAESGHGDIGMSAAGDIFFILSKSGESKELEFILDFAKRNGNDVIALCGRQKSTLGQAATVFIPLEIDREICPMNLAPTTSALVSLAVGDALTVCLMRRRGFTREQYRFYHAAGDIGRQLLKVSDMMHDLDRIVMMPTDSMLADVLEEITRLHVGEAIFTDRDGRLRGIITDGDIRKFLIQHHSIDGVRAKDVMTTEPKTVFPDSFVGEALNIMEGRFFALVVVDREHRPRGIIRIHDILRRGAV